MDAVEFVMVILAGILIFFLFPLIFGEILYSTGGTEIVRVEILEDACKAIYGEDYQWVDYKSGVENNLICEPIAPEPEANKLNGFGIYNKTPKKGWEK